LNELEKKILWQCRRGLWELDAILVPFVERKFSTLSETEVENFRELLSFEDIDMFDI
jgi:antitoxin CptB